MVAIFGTESFETGPVGATMTATNTGFSGVDPGWTFVDTPATPAGLGSLAGQVVVAAGVASYAQANWTATDIIVPRLYVRFPSIPAVGSVDVATLRAGVSLRARLGIVDGQFVMRNGSTVVWTSTTPVAPAKWHRLEWWTDNTAGEQLLRMFLGDNHHGTSPDESSGAQTFSPGVAADRMRVGPAQSSLTTSWTAIYDAIVVSDVYWPGPGYTDPGSGGGGSVSVSAGSDKLGVEPWSTVTLTATTVGTVTGVVWSQTGGTPTVVLKPTGDPKVVTFEAPGTIQGASQLFQATATHAGGTVTDSVAVTTRAVTERIVQGGKEVPLRVSVVTGTGTGWDPTAAWQGGTAWGDH